MSSDTVRASRGSGEEITASPPRPAIIPKDIYEVPRLAVQGLLAWTLPESCLVAAVSFVRSSECRNAPLAHAS